MRIEWSATAQRDIIRLGDFLRPVNPRAAARVMRMLVDSVSRLVDYPRVAPPIEVYEGRDVRSLIIGDYNMHYEIKADVIYIVRVWHTREDR